MIAIFNLLIFIETYLTKQIYVNKQVKSLSSGGLDCLLRPASRDALLSDFEAPI